MAIALLLGLSFSVKLYGKKEEVALIYEDHLDMLLFQQVKRGRTPTQLARALYCTD